MDHSKLRGSDGIQEGTSEWPIGLILTLAFLFMFIIGIGDFTDVIEKKTFGLRSRISASSERNPDIELVVIGEDDLAEIGRFPWPRMWATDTREQRSWPNMSER